MKTSIIFSSLALGLLLCTTAWAQDEDVAEAAAAEVIEEASADPVDSTDNDEAATQAASDEADEAAADAEPGDTTTEAAGSLDGDDASSEPIMPDDSDAAEAIEATEADEASEPAEVDEATDAAEIIEADEASESESAEVDTEAGPDLPTEQSQSASEVPSTTDIFVFQGHPIFTSDQAELVYRPLVNYLNDTLPYRFELEIVPDFHRYWLSIRRGEHPHLVLEEPHLTALRIERHGYTPLVRAAEPLSYSLLTTMTEEAGESSVRDFIARPVSTMPAPSLGYLILASWFDNPMQQPVIQSSASSWLDAVEIVFSLEAHAAMVPNNLVERYVNMDNVLTSREFPGLTISASPAVPDHIQEEIHDALLILHENESHYAVLHELDIDRFAPAVLSEYLGLDSWLDLVYADY